MFLPMKGCSDRQNARLGASVGFFFIKLDTFHSLTFALSHVVICTLKDLAEEPAVIVTFELVNRGLLSDFNALRCLYELSFQR